MGGFAGVFFFAAAADFFTGFLAGIFIPGVILCCAESACVVESDFCVVGGWALRVSPAKTAAKSVPTE